MKTTFRISENLLARIVASLLCVLVMAGAWDVWWHFSVGRDTASEPPHLMIYSSTAVLILLGLWGWKTFHNVIWRNIGIALLLIPISAPFDELWHQMFGVEDLSTVWAIWSPPHLALIAAIIVSCLMVLPALNQDKNNQLRDFFGSIMWASIISLSLLVTEPFNPTEGWALLGFYGTIIPAFIFVFLLWHAKKWISAPHGATLTMIFLILFMGLMEIGERAPDIIIQPHDHAPIFLVTFSLLGVGIIFDALYRFSIMTRTILAMIFWGLCMYIFVLPFFDVQFQYPLESGLVSLIFSVLGGILAVFLFRATSRQ